MINDNTKLNKGHRYSKFDCEQETIFLRANSLANAQQHLQKIGGSVVK